DVSGKLTLLTAAVCFRLYICTLHAQWSLPCVQIELLTVVPAARAVKTNSSMAVLIGLRFRVSGSGSFRESQRFGVTAESSGRWNTRHEAALGRTARRSAERYMEPLPLLRKAN